MTKQILVILMSLVLASPVLMAYGGEGQQETVEQREARLEAERRAHEEHMRRIREERQRREQRHSERHGSRAADRAGVDTSQANTEDRSLHNNLMDAAGQQQAGQQANQMAQMSLMAAAAAAAASKNYGLAAMLAMLGGLAGQQAGQMGAASGANFQYGGYVGETWNPSGVGYGDGSQGSGSSSTFGASGAGSGTPEMRAAAADMKRLEAEGFRFNSDGSITDPMGRNYTADQTRSESAMRQAGLSDSDISALNRTMGDVDKKVGDYVDSLIGAVEVGEANYGGGMAGIGGGGFGSSNDFASSDYQYTHSNNGLGDRDPAQVAGLSKMYNGEPIGVAGDDIWKMHTRRVKALDQQGYFLGETGN